MKLRDIVDALKVTDTGCWRVCVHPSGRGLWKQTISIHLRTAHIPAHDLFGESEKRGAGDVPVSWAAEVVMTLQYSGLPSVPLVHLHLFIYASLCFSASFFTPHIHLIPLTSGLTLIWWIIFKPKYCLCLFSWMVGGKHQPCHFLLIKSFICCINGLCLMFSLLYSRTWGVLGTFICFFFIRLTLKCHLMTVAFSLTLVTVTMCNIILMPMCCA